MPTPKTMPYIGRALKRVEDPRLIQGIATYVDDLALPGMLHAAILRSPYAHARINSVRTEAASAAPGVVGVFTGANVNDKCGVVPCASPQYLASHGAPRTPEELAGHNCFTYEYVSPRHVWRFRDRAGAERAVRVSGRLHSNNGDLLAEVAAQGAGIVFEPAFIVGPEVRAGRLVPLLQEYVPPPVPIYALYPSRKHLSAKVRRFVDFLTERFAGAEDWSVA